MFLKEKARRLLRKRLYDVTLEPKEVLRRRIHSFTSNFQGCIPDQKREVHAYCVGLPRSGTHSIAYIFERNFLARHEPEARETILTILEWSLGYYSERNMLNILSLRDKKLRLNIESAHYMHQVVELLVRLYPEAKFILTVREPAEWLESEINQTFTTRGSALWRSFQLHRYGQYEIKYDTSELELFRAFPHIFPIQAYLLYWRDHISTVLKHVKKDNLLIVETKNIESRLVDIAEFIGAEPACADKQKGLSARRKEKFDIYEFIDHSIVQEKIRASLSDFIEENLPFLVKDKETC